MTYLLLNLLFCITLLFFLPKKRAKPSKAWWFTLVIVVVLTMVFDPIIIALNIVAYDPTKLLGVYLFGAPIEDFFYAVYAVCLVPLVWSKLEIRHEQSS